MSDLIQIEKLKELFGEWIDRIERRQNYEITIEGKSVKIPMPIKRVGRYISRVYAEIDHAKNPETWKERKKLQKKIDTIDTRVCSAMLLNRLFAIPFLHSIYWRWLEWTKNDKFITGVVHCRYMQDKQGFFLLNSNSIKTHYESQQMMIKMDQK